MCNHPHAPPAVRVIFRDAFPHFLTLRQWVRDVMRNNDASHDIHHVDAVVFHATQIVQHWDDDQLKMASVLVALLHEFCDRKYVKDRDAALSLLRSTLDETPLDRRVSNMVVAVVPTISFSRRLAEGTPSFLSEEEMRVYDAVSDADYLESLGATGVVRTHIYQAVTVAGTISDHVMQRANTFIQSHLVRTYDFLKSDYARAEGRRRLVRTHRICTELAWEREQMATPPLPDTRYDGDSGNARVIVAAQWVMLAVVVSCIGSMVVRAWCIASTCGQYDAHLPVFATMDERTSVWTVF